MAKVKVIGEPTGIPTHIFVDGEEIHRVKAISFYVSVESPPTFSIEMSSAPEIELDGRVEFSFEPNTVEEATKVLRNALIFDKDFYNGLVASIESVLREQCLVWADSTDYNENEYKNFARKIANRIIGI